MQIIILFQLSGVPWYHLMFNKLLYSIILSGLIVSCNVDENEIDPGFSISSPKKDWVYNDDMPVLFAVNVDTDFVQWSSSLEGNLGAGNNLQRWISPGSHIITAEINGIKKTVAVNINKKVLNTYDEIKILLNYFPLIRQFSQGDYYPCLTSLDGSVEKLSVSMNNTNVKTHRNYNNYNPGRTALNTDIRLLRDFRPVQHLKPGINNAVTRTLKKTFIKSYNIGDTRNFRVINTASQGSDPHMVEAELYYTSSNFNLWKPSGTIIDSITLQYCIDKIENLILPRIHIIWGTQADIDVDGKIAVLLSQTINDEKLAIGFFNPSDFFKYNNDPASENYNPASNEMDILYIAVPENKSGSPYSPDSIVATIGHELTHAVNFTNKTWNRIQDGESDIPQEEVFLDEGWSHLSENLLGYGISGGNILFFHLFLNDTASYSFCKANSSGQYDSAGMRGAMTLFMSWLFWKKAV